VAADLHANDFGDSGAHHVPDGAAAQIVKEQAFTLRRLRDCFPRSAKVSDSDALAGLFCAREYSFIGILPRATRRKQLLGVFRQVHLARLAILIRLTNLGERFVQPELADFGQPVLQTIVKTFEDQINILTYPEEDKESLKLKLREAVAKKLPEFFVTF
jgi:hypothetical protein